MYLATFLLAIALSFSSVKANDALIQVIEPNAATVWTTGQQSLLKWRYSPVVQYSDFIGCSVDLYTTDRAFLQPLASRLPLEQHYIVLDSSMTSRFLAHPSVVLKFSLVENTGQVFEVFSEPFVIVEPQFNEGSSSASASASANAQAASLPAIYKRSEAKQIEDEEEHKKEEEEEESEESEDDIGADVGAALTNAFTCPEDDRDCSETKSSANSVTPAIVFVTVLGCLVTV